MPPKTARPRPLPSLALVTVLALAGCGSAIAQPQSARPATGVEAAAASRMPAWVEGAVVYGAVPPLFGHSPLRDLTGKLDHLKQQGIDAVWLSPVNSTDDPSTISYAVTDYQGLREDFGTKADFKRLVSEAHGRGIKVLMDFVPNHTSSGHPHFQDTLARGAKSPYWNHYMRDEAGKPQFYFDWENLINLNFAEPAVQKMVTDGFAYWVREMGVDGFRVDAAWGPKDRQPDYWPKLSAELERLNPEIFLLAEASARDPYYVRNGFHAAYDWGKELGHWSWEKAFDDPNKAGDQLRRALAGRETPPEQIARFLNNNDTGERFITRHGVATQRVAAVLLHTLPGIPVVYTGEEVGAEFEPYEDPPPLEWTDRHRLQPLYRRLAELKGTMPALRRGDWHEAKVTKAPGAYVFTRDAGQGEWALVVLNFGAAGPVTFTLPAGLREAARGPLVDALTGKPVSLAPGAAQSIKMGAASALVIAPVASVKR